MKDIKHLNENKFPLVCYVYAMLVCSMVEINLDTIFICGLVLLAAYARYSNAENCKDLNTTVKRKVKIWKIRI